ncbi:MAG TPA: polyketide synthase, partial [Chloroflexota bacterium]|nr:polyketide synthase [Chloroflexota bacterium]
MVLEPIAIVGLGCRFPGAPDPASFWRLLREGGEAIREVPPDRWDVDALFDPDPEAPGKMTSRRAGFLDQIDRFDPAFFGISPREARSMDPQQRLLLEVAWEALEDASLPPPALAGTSTGVFVGICSFDYAWRQAGDLALTEAYSGTGTAHSIAANRLSYLLDLRGPSLAVDTACSSSLIAVHLACQSIWRGESIMALAGGVNVIASPEGSIGFSKARMTATDGRCKAFDAAADGYVRGEGCGVVVLKPLAAARRDGDTILALIRGTATNQDGRSNGLTAPNGPAQQAVIRAALQSAGVAPEQVGFVEAHGTGTPLGDPIELQALMAVLGPGRSAGEPLVVGSVKPNIGHLEGAAGIAALIKTVLCLHHEEIAPQINFTSLNPLVKPGKRLVVPTEPRPWPRGALPRVAGVSSFGFGGANAHAVLEEAPLPEASTVAG